MLSRLSHGKHLRDALDVLERVRSRGVDATLAIAGEETDRGARAALVRMARDASLGPHLRLLGYRADIARLFGGFDVLLHTAHAESFGLALLEAMAHGCPVVASAGGGVPELVSHLETGWLAMPGDVGSLAEGVLAFGGDPRLAERVTANARRDVEIRFPPALEASRLAGIYGELAGGIGNRARIETT
jgi:glycosyltransferase involved in cell wall biosynthesis